MKKLILLRQPGTFLCGTCRDGQPAISHCQTRKTPFQAPQAASRHFPDSQPSFRQQAAPRAEAIEGVTVPKRELVLNSTTVFISEEPQRFGIQDCDRTITGRQPSFLGKPLQGGVDLAA
ncbi:MAG: hypothetical protein K0S56_2307 [Microvirga sp.]|nr:hypothetical protein [Microvirga sp.]